MPGRSLKLRYFLFACLFLALLLSSWKINDAENDGECLKIEGTQATIKCDSGGNYLQKWAMGMVCGQMAFPCSRSVFFLCTTLSHKNFLLKKRKKHPTWPPFQALLNEIHRFHHNTLIHIWSTNIVNCILDFLKKWWAVFVGWLLGYRYAIAMHPMLGWCGLLIGCR